MWYISGKKLNEENKRNKYADRKSNGFEIQNISKKIRKLPFDSFEPHILRNQRETFSNGGKENVVIKLIIFL